MVIGPDEHRRAGQRAVGLQQARKESARTRGPLEGQAVYADSVADVHSILQASRALQLSEDGAERSGAARERSCGASEVCIGAVHNAAQGRKVVPL